MISADPETSRREGRLRMKAESCMIAAALGIMFFALVLAAASVKASPLPNPDAPTIRPFDTMLVLRETDGSFAMLVPMAAEITARVDPLSARITVQHRFRAGPGAARAGVYILPLPADAAPRRLELAVGERRLEIGLATEPSDAEPELLTLPIDGIGAHAEIVVQVTYERPVALGNGRFVLALPLPRRSDAPQISNADWVEAGTSLRLELDPGVPIGELRSPSHGIDIERGPAERRRIVLSDSEPADGRDFILVWKPANPGASIAALRRYASAQAQDQAATGDALILRARPVGSLLALAPALPHSALPPGSPIDDSGLLTAITAKTGAARRDSGPTVSNAVGASILLIWALGAVYLAARRSADRGFSTTSQTGIAP